MLRPYVRSDLYTEQLRRPPLRQGLEPPAGPERRAGRHLIDQPIPDPDLARQLLDIRLRAEEAVRAAFHDEAVPSLGEGDAAGPPLGLEYQGIRARPRELPGRRQPRESRPHHGDGHTHPRAAAALCAISASAPT